MEMKSHPFPRKPGSYLLMLALPSNQQIQVGRLGCIGFESGWYAYAGSAFGPGGLAARLSRHFGPVQKRHWHIDYLRAEAVAREAWFFIGPPSREHDWSLVLAKGAGAGRWVRGFGCSDCRCPSHLIYFGRRPAPDLIRKKLGPCVEWLQLTTRPAGNLRLNHRQTGRT